MLEGPFFEETDMTDGWVSAHEWLQRYNEYEAEELDKRRFIEWLMEQQWTPEGNKQ